MDISIEFPSTVLVSINLLKHFSCFLIPGHSLHQLLQISFSTQANLALFFTSNIHSAQQFIKLLCFALLCFALICFALLCFALLYISFFYIKQACKEAQCGGSFNCDNNTTPKQCLTWLGVVTLLHQLFNLSSSSTLCSFVQLRLFNFI